MKNPTFPLQSMTAVDAFDRLDATGSGISQRLLEHAAARRHGREDLDAEPQRRIAQRPALSEIIERAEIDAGSDEAYFLAQLRAVVAAFETPADRLLAQYRDWPSGPAQFYGVQRDWDDPRGRTAGLRGPVGASATGCAAALPVGK